MLERRCLLMMSLRFEQEGGVSKMKASPMSLFEEFIKEAFGSQYVIPVYQRNYTWRKAKQVQQLLDDVQKILEGQVSRHFIGTIVYVIVKTDFMVRERAVVDGQQRLITMFLIAHALRAIANENGNDEVASALTSDYLENSNKQDDYRFRLRPSVSDDSVYSYIAKQQFDDVAPSSSKIYENYNYIKSELSKKVDKYGLMSVVNAIREIYIVRIELEDTDNAQQIFESINSTGEKLTAADLIRNFILMNKQSDKQEIIYRDYWLKLEVVFKDSKKLEEFFRLYLATKNYTLSPVKELYEQFKVFWKESLSQNSEDSLLSDILIFAKHFDRLYYSTDKDVLGEPIADFRKLQTLMPAPFVMQLLELNRINPTIVTNDKTSKILKLIVCYLIRRYIAGQDTSAITRFFPTYLKNVLSYAEKYGFDNLFDICKYLLVNDTRQKSMFMPDDTQVKQYLSNANAYTLQHTRWLLEKIELTGNNILFDLSGLSIDHIMPQKPKEYWPEVKDLPKDEYDVCVNRLGNLTLVAAVDNSAMSNKNFAHKKNVLLKTTQLRINQDILTKDKWTIADINDRTNYLIEKILLLFPYEKSDTSYDVDDSVRSISLNRAEIVALGYLHKDERVTIFADSIVRYDTAPNLQSLRELRDELIEKEIIACDNGVYKFTQDYTFNSPSGAADFIIGGSNNGWDCFKDNNGAVINDSLRGKN